MVLIKNLLANILFLVAVSAFGQLNRKTDTVSIPTVQNSNNLVGAGTETKSDTVPVIVNPILNDSTLISPIQASNDSVPKPVLEATITYSAVDSIIPDFINQKVYMYKGGVVNYQNIELKADYIELDLANKEVYAEGLPDSTGTKVGTPVFKDGTEEFESKTMRYNFETQKGIITDVKTKQGDGFVHSDLTKKIRRMSLCSEEVNTQHVMLNTHIFICV